MRRLEVSLESWRLTPFEPATAEPQALDFAEALDPTSLYGARSLPLFV